MDVIVNIYDSPSLKPIMSGSFSFIFNGSKQDFVFSNGTFNINNFENSSTFQLVVTAPGYNKLIIPASDIQDYIDTNNSNDVFNIGLVKTNTNVALLGLGAVLLLMQKKKSIAGIGKLETKDLVPYGIIVGVVIVGGFVKKLFNFLGITDSAESRNLDNLSSNPLSFWNPNFYKQYLPRNFTHTISSSQANDLIDQITSAMGIFYDDVPAVTAAFHTLQTQAEVSYLADVFNQSQGADLLQWLRGTTYPADRLSDAEVTDINNFLQQLPTN